MLEKKLLLTIAAAMSFAALHAQPARAQAETPRVEIGAHFSLIRLPRPQFDSTVLGVGGRITFNFNSHVAVEGEFNFFPKDLPGRPSLSGQQTQGLFGLKAGIRSSRAGIFGKVRPGYMRFWQAHEGIVCIAVFPAPFGCELARRGRTGFALDLGGVVEFYPSRHTVVRFDLGDTVINFQGPFFEGRSLTTHSLQFNAGVGFRF
jgi:outer membrane protein with beta-barrel domain